MIRSLVCLVMVCQPAFATCHVKRQVAVVKEVVAVKEVIVEPVVAVYAPLKVVPLVTYGLQYTPPAVPHPAPEPPRGQEPPQPPGADPELKRELDKIRAEFEAFKNRTRQQDQQQADEGGNVGAVLKKNCFACHGQDANVKGGGLQMFNNNGLIVSEKQIPVILSRVMTNEMPPRNPLSDNEKSIIAKGLVGK